MVGRPRSVKAPGAPCVPAPPDPLRAMLWAVGYGAVCVAAGIAVLRRRSILT